jgi:multiple sugar transport system permease protein
MGSNKYRIYRNIETLLKYFLLIITLFIILFPVLWMISIAFKPDAVFFIVPPEWIPKHPTLEHIFKVINADWFYTYVKNTVFLTLSTTTICLVIGSLAGYSLSRFNYRGRNIIMLFLLTSQMFPLVMYLIPFYASYAKLHWLNTYHALILSYLSIALPLAIWLMKSFFDTIPIDLEEAAMIDGDTRLGALWSVILPNVLPGLIAVGLFTLLICYDEYMYTVTLMSNESMRTLAVGAVERWVSMFRYDWGGLMAMATIMSFPIVILFLVLQRYFISGLTAGAVKG